MTVAAEPVSLELDPSPKETGCSKQSRKSKLRSTLKRWCKFNLVGAMGIVVQFAVLFLLKGVLHFNYLAATGIAVEGAVLHNFAWHERFTWADRILFESAGAKLFRTSSRGWQRLLRFHFANGIVSLFGNLALMKVMVGFGGMNYVAADAIAIAICSLANFIASEHWVFGEAKEA